MQIALVLVRLGWTHLVLVGWHFVASVASMLAVTWCAIRIVLGLDQGRSRLLFTSVGQLHPKD